MLSFKTKIAAFAGLLSLGLVAGTATPAEASYVTRSCDSYGCYRVRCSDDGLACRRISGYFESDYDADDFYDRPYYHRDARYLCNSDGEDCRWTNYYRDGDNTY
jgi:hypothetical protein